jgi:peroxiredoxin
MNTTQRKPLAAGTKAPDFTLKVTPDQAITLSELRGQPVVIVFYPADFSPICSDEMALYNEVLPEFQKHNAQILGISVDNVWSHLEFGEQHNLHFPLLSDFHPKGEVSQAYQAYLDAIGESNRAVYVIDSDGVIAWSYSAPLGVNPGADGALRAVEELTADA